jgi:hypothetical protein
VVLFDLIMHGVPKGQRTCSAVAKNYALWTRPTSGGTAPRGESRIASRKGLLYPPLTLAEDARGPRRRSLVPTKRK